MSDKLDYLKAPADNLKTWEVLQRVIIVSSVLTAMTLIILFFAFMYQG